MTLIETAGARAKPPCKGCKARVSCTEEIMETCTAFRNYDGKTPDERGKMAYRKHLQWIVRHTEWRK